MLAWGQHSGKNENRLVPAMPFKRNLSLCLSLILGLSLWQSDYVASTALAKGGKKAIRSEAIDDRAAKPPSKAQKTHSYTFENVLGTSFSLDVRVSSKAKAEAVRARIFKEIKHRKRLMSTYDSNSELSKINARAFVKGEAIAVSTSLWLLLRDSHRIQRLTRGSFNAYLGDLIQLWRQCAKKSRLPTDAEIEAAMMGARAGFKVWSDKNDNDFLTRLGPGSFQVDGIGKGYIMDKAMREAKESVSGVDGIKIDIGGDIIAHGDKAWLLGVADPARSADNAPALTTVRLKNMAMATSGAYERSLKIGGQLYNHILDPATGRPADGVLSATVIASRARIADALATALCVMAPKAAIRLIEDKTSAVCLIVDRSGKQYRSRGFAAFEVVKPSARAGKPSQWPAGYRVTVGFKLINSWKTVNKPRRKKRFKRHFVGAWVEDMAGRRLRILALWAKRKDLKYVRDLNHFWKYAWILAGQEDSSRAVKAYSRATRAAGAYRLLWDGRDDAGDAVAKGRYRICIDINREHGPPRGREIHSSVFVLIDCGKEASSAKARDQPELSHVTVHYGPGK
jgi:FAD:protein FMN transferase